MAFTTNDWDEDYKRAQSALTQLRANPSRKSNLDSIASAFDRLSIRLKQMEKAPFDFNISHSEVARKVVQIESMRSQLDSCRSTNSNSNYISNPEPDSDSSRNAVLQTSQMVMSAQDDMLSELADGVSRLKDQSYMINDESKFHVRLLDDMDVDVEKATAGLRAEARHAQKIRQESSVCKLYIIIAGLTALLCFLIVMGISH
ncbi:hypothetical protein ScalyP_jg7265 [Parmales sp. scaly parma]|nr:hypothetical protein ScalyP_jg7265 [Parmales sp. scaly parma]